MSIYSSRDLVVLVADKNLEFALRGILCRCRALRIKEIQPEIYVHPHRDPGCLRGGVDFLRPFINKCAHALIIFDREGCGQSNKSREQLESNVEEQLTKSGWDGRAAVVVIDPELENWVWSTSPHVDKVLGWKKGSIRRWLVNEGLLRSGQAKPEKPKEALERTLQISRTSRSSALYLQLAEKVSFREC